MKRKILAIVLLLAGLRFIAQAEPQAWLNSAVQPFDCGQTIQIKAVPKTGYQFLQWEDGVKDNPREIEVKEATSGLYRAYFAKATPTGIEDAKFTPIARKVLINNQLFIIRGEELYDATGKRVR